MLGIESPIGSACAGVAKCAAAARIAIVTTTGRRTRKAASTSTIAAAALRRLSRGTLGIDMAWRCKIITVAMCALHFPDGHAPMRHKFHFGNGGSQRSH
jgi:hypothetical protein